MLKKKKLIIMFFVSFFTLLTANTSFTRASADEAPLTIETYKNYLFNNDVQAYSEFTNLSNYQQQNIINALLDPTTYNNAANWQENDIVVSNRASGSRTAWGKRGVYIAGFAILEYKVEVNYAYNGGKATRIYSSSAYVTRNLNPLVQTSLLSKNTWIANGQVNLNAKFKYDLGPIKGLSVRIGVLNTRFSANGHGRVLQNSWYQE